MKTTLNSDAFETNDFKEKSSDRLLFVKKDFEESNTVGEDIGGRPRILFAFPDIHHVLEEYSVILKNKETTLYV